MTSPISHLQLWSGSKTTMKYLMPDYYPSFVCKGGACNLTCCKGWNVSISMKEYFNLLGKDCSTDLRKRLDCAFFLSKTPSPDNYAYIKHNYLGECPMRNESGLCGLQIELGEQQIPFVCRYYPRNFIPLYQYECSCANSCEAVIELLINRKDKLNFCYEERTFDTPLPAPKEKVGLACLYDSIREKCIEILQNRNLSFDDRMIVMGQLIYTLFSYSNIDIAKVIQDFDINSLNHIPYSIDRKKAFLTQMELANIFEEFSPTIKECNVDVKRNLHLDTCNFDIDKSLELLENAMTHLDKLVDDKQSALENIIVNHLFYSKFPFSDPNMNIWEDYVSFCACYAYLKYFVAGYMVDEITKEALIDVISKVFRFVEHSNFDRNADIIFNKEHISDLVSIASFLKSII